MELYFKFRFWLEAIAIGAFLIGMLVLFILYIYYSKFYKGD